jgi:hypothetical protein
MKNYIIAGIILIGLSILGFWWLKDTKNISTGDEESIVIPTSSSKTNAKPTIKPTLVPTIKPSLSYNGHLKVVEDGFEAFFAKNREVYKEYESTGVRYPLWRKDSIITVHVSRGNWCWLHPGRNFSSTEKVAGRETFVYNISSQKLVDVENNGKKYTIQCLAKFKLL